MTIHSMRLSGRRVLPFVLGLLVCLAGCEEFDLLLGYSSAIHVQGEPEVVALEPATALSLDGDDLTNVEWQTVAACDRLPEAFAIQTARGDRVQVLLGDRGVLDIQPGSLALVNGHSVSNVVLLEGCASFIAIPESLRAGYGALTNSAARRDFLAIHAAKFVEKKGGQWLVKNPFRVETSFSSLVAHKGRTFSIIVDSNHPLEFHDFRLKNLRPKFARIPTREKKRYRYMAVTGLDIYEKTDNLHFFAQARDADGNWVQLHAFIPTEAFRISMMRGRRLAVGQKITKSNRRFQLRFQQELAARLNTPALRRTYRRELAQINQRTRFYRKSRRILSQKAALQRSSAFFRNLFAKSTPEKIWRERFLFPSNGVITSGFGKFRTYYGGTTAVHRGIDIGAPIGTAIRAPNGGLVVYVGTNPAQGRNIVIDHGMGVFTALMHLSEMYVKAGDSVQRGDVIATMGNSGLSSGPHLHWEMRVNGRPVNPLEWVNQKF
jgi:murein DD-endopeptidase MepM/ murein hydrolase activator NlpD